MKISVVSNLYPPTIRGGAEISSKILVKGLQSEGAEVQVIEIGPELGRRTDDGTSVVAVGNMHPYYAANDTPRTAYQKALWHSIECSSAGPYERASSAIASFGSDVIFTQNLTGFGVRFPSALRASLPLSMPMIHTLRDYGLLCVRNTLYHHGRNGCKGQVACSVKTRVARHSSDAFAGVVGISEFILAEHRRRSFFRDAQPLVIHNSVQESQDRTLALGGRTSHLGYLGRLSEEKGVFDLLRAYRNASQISASLGTLFLAGSGSERDLASLRELAVGLDVVFMGSVEPTELFRKVGTLVIPSRWDEPFGRVAVEGADAGLRLLVSTKGGLQEAVRTVRPDSSGVVYFDGGDERQLTQALHKISRLAVDSPGSVVRRTASDVAREYLSFAEQILG